MGEKIQWHPGFYAGIELELRAYHLDFDQEHQVTRGPLSIDLLIIRKQTDENIDHEIGEFFRKHNVVEYKSPDDELSIDVYYKAQAYAGLYKASGERVNEIPAEEVTVSLFREGYPREMAEQLKGLGAEIEKRHDGIYEIRRAGLFPTQLIVTGELKAERHSTLRVLSNRASRADVEAFLRATKGLRSAGDIAKLDAILQVSATANRAIYEGIYREETEMCQALRDIMREDFARAEKRGISIGEVRGEARGIKEGADQKNRDNARGFKNAGVDPSIIAKVTGLSAAEIATL